MAQVAEAEYILKMATLTYYYGPMYAGKSTMALQMDHMLGIDGGSSGVLVTAGGRNVTGLESRLGLAKDAYVADPDTDLFELVKGRTQTLFVIVDEAQFLTPTQIESLARVVDELGIDVFAFGLKADFTGHLFPGSARLLELSDAERELPLPVLCWCGCRGRFNARVVNGVVAAGGPQVAIEDGTVSYRVLCRRHFLARQLHE